MGCCSSSTAKTPPPPPHTPPPDEDTVVKEVLSETPIFKPTPQTHSQPPPPSQLPLNSISTIFNYNATIISQQQSNPPPLPHNGAFQSIPKDKTNHTNISSTHQRHLTAGVNRQKAESLEEKTPEVSQASEISTATTTTTVTEIRDNEVTSKKRVSPEKFQRKRPHAADRVAPPRRERQINGGVRREVSRAVNRDIGEGSSRRSRSPATRVTNGGVGKGRGDGRVTEGVVNRLVENKEEKCGGSGEEQGSESLDNPLVSLECFIFL